MEQSLQSCLQISLFSKWRQAGFAFSEDTILRLSSGVEFIA
jgi:hypothetical protein